MLNEATIHAGFSDTRAKAAREEKMISAFYVISAEDTLCVSLVPLNHKPFSCVRRFKIANQRIKDCLGIA